MKFTESTTAHCFSRSKQDQEKLTFLTDNTGYTFQMLSTMMSHCTVRLADPRNAMIMTGARAICDWELSLK